VPEPSLRKVLAVLRARWLLVVVLAVPVLVASAWYAVTRPTSYTSEVVLTFSPEPLASPDVSFIRLLPRYLVAATAPESLQAAAVVSGVPVADLRDSVTSVNPGGTVEIRVTVTTPSPRSSQLAAASLADSVIAATGTDPLVGARVLDAADEPSDGAPLRQLVALAAGLFLCPLPGIGLAFTLEGARPRVRAREDVQGLGITTPATVRRRRLTRMRARDTDELAPLVLDVRATTGDPSRTPVVVTSPTSSEADAVAQVTAALAAAVDLPHTADTGSAGNGAATLGSAPGLLTDEAARSAVLRAGQCVLVLPSGTATDRAQDCVHLLERLDVRLVGAVLLR
jgi:capsular polysaccharide biosynthesis protein